MMRYGGAIYICRWLKQLSREEERPLNKSIEPIGERHHESQTFQSKFLDLIYVTTCFQLDIIYLCSMRHMLKDDLNPGFLQVMIMYISLGPALMYMEIFLGQYVRHGCLYLKNVSPLTCSAIGYGMLLSMYVYSVASVNRLADCYIYLFRTLSSELPWMVCPKDSTPAMCIDRALLMKCYLENRKDNCYSKLTPDLLSSRIYYKATHSATSTKRLSLLLIGWFTIYIAMKRSLSHTRVMVKRLLLLILVLFLCLLAPLLAYVSMGLSVAPFFTIRPKALLSTSAWTAAFRDFLIDHAVVRGGYQLIGCHIQPGPAVSNLTIYSCIITYLITIFSQIFSTGILGVLIFYMKVDHIEEEIYFPRYAKLFSFYPFALGMLEVRKFWSLVYFSLVALLSISYTVVNLVIIEESVYDHYPVMLRYKTYTKVILCLFGFVLDICSDLVTDINSYEDKILLQIGYRLTVIIVLILAISIGYIYGIDRFSDDMNFLNGSQPTTYWKICWKCLPFALLIVLGGDIIVIDFPSDDVPRLTLNIIYVFLLCLAVLHLLHRIVMSIKARNVTGMLFQATPQWGPPNPEDRRMRNTYNPREETKYWRKNSLCTHHCLLDKDFIISIIYREINSRTTGVRHDTYVSCMELLDFKMVEQQAEPYNVVIAIDKVSSAQLETFEEQVKQKVKYLEEIEEAKVNLKHRTDIVANKRASMTKSMEELDHRIEQMIQQAERQAGLESENIDTKVLKTPSKTKQRRLPTYIPKDTRRIKRTKEAAISDKKKDTNDQETNKFHTYVVQVPPFVLKPTAGILPHSDSVNSTRKFEASQLSAAEREILQVEDASPSLASISNDILKSSTPKSPSSRVPPKKSALKPRAPVMRKLHLPAWPLPLNTPRPTISPRLSRSSSSTSTTSRETSRQPSNYFLDVRLPPKANLPLPAYSVNLHSPPRSPQSSNASSELSELTRDPLLCEILHSVQPDLFPAGHYDVLGTSLRPDRTFHRHTLGPNTRKNLLSHPRTSIATLSKSPRFLESVPRKQQLSSPMVPALQPVAKMTQPISCTRAVGEELLQSSYKQKMKDLPVKLTNNESDRQILTIKDEESAVDIDQAIQMRINNLLQGVRVSGRSADQKQDNSSGRTKPINGLEAEEGPGVEDLQPDIQGEESSKDFSNQSKAEKKWRGQSSPINSIATRILAFRNKIAKKIRLGSTSPDVHQVSETNAETITHFGTTDCEKQEIPESIDPHLE